MGKVAEIDCEKSMKLETSRNVTKSKRSLHWCRSISKKISVQVLLQYQSKSYYIIGQEVYYSIGRFYDIIGQLLYIIGRFLLHYRARITVSGVYYIIGWYSNYRAYRTMWMGNIQSGQELSMWMQQGSHKTVTRHIVGNSLHPIQQWIKPADNDGNYRAVVSCADQLLH